MANLCPCCGKEFDGPRSKALILLADRRIVYYLGKSITLSETHAIILRALIKAQGLFLSRDTLELAVSCESRRDITPLTITGAIRVLRDELRKLGLSIAGGGWNKGWSLSFRGKVFIINSDDMVRQWIETANQMSKTDVS